MSRQSKTKFSDKVNKDQKKTNKKISTNTIQTKISEEQYRLIADFTYDWEFWLSPDGNFIYNTPSCKRISGREPKEFTDNPELFRNIIHPDDRNIWDVHRHESTLGKQSLSVEFRIINIDGTVHWIEHFCNPIYDYQAKFIGTRGSNRDITLRKLKIENTLRESEEKLKMAELIGKIGHWEYDILNNSIYWSDQTYRLYERDINLGPPSEKEETGYYSEETAKKIKGYAAKVIETGKSIENYTFQVILPSRRFAIYESSMHPIKNESGKIIKLFGTIQDITESKIAEEALKKSEFRLNRAELISRLGNFEIDLKSGIITASSSAKKIYGVEGSNRQLTEIQKMSLGEYRGYLDNSLKNLIEKNIPYNVEFKIKKYDTGEILDIHSIAEYDRENKIVYGIVQDITDRKRTEEALKKSEFGLNRAELISRLGNWEIDLKTGIITGSTGAKKIYGVEKDNWKLSEIQKIPLAEYREFLDNALKNLIEKNIPYNVEFKIKKYDTGEILDIHSIAEYDRENKIVYGMVQDITDQKRVEEALRKSEAKSRALNELISDYTFEFTVSPDGSISLTETSENFERITGRSKENVKTIDSWKTIFYPEDLPRVMTNLGLLVRNGRPFDLECRTFVHQGTRRWIHIVAKVSHFDIYGKPTAIIGSVKDITERKMAEESLKASEERFRKLLQSVTDYIYTVNVVNGKAVSTYHGTACLSVTGYASEEFSNDPFLWYNIIHKDDKKSTIEITDKITKGESFSAFEHRIIHKSGTIRWVRNTPVIRRNDKGEVIEYDGLITDITEKKIAEEEIIKLNLVLEARVQERTMELALANKELEAFSYSVSHDLKSPLRTISGFSCLAMEKIDKKDIELLSHLKKIYSSSDKMSKLIDDLLNLSRITQQEINKMTFDISELVKKIFDELCEQYPNLKIEFNYQKKIKIMADFDLVKIMIKNLLNNALKYSSKKSKIKIEFGSLKEKEKLTFFIKDNGDGFDMKYADKIFTPFQRLHSDKEFEGTGIGLAIVQRIVKKHGGNVWIDSKKGTGTSVFFNL